MPLSLAGAPTADNLRLIEDVLLDYSTKSSKFLPPDALSLRIGQNVCAKSLEDGVLYRAIVRQAEQHNVTVSISEAMYILGT